MSRLVLLRMRNVSDESSKYDRGGQATDDNNIRRMRIACRLPNVTHTHSEYVILISFPQQKMDARTRLNITLIRTLSLVLFYPKTIVCHLTDDIPPRVWEVGRVGYVSTMNEAVVCGNRKLPDKIMIVCYWIPLQVKNLLRCSFRWVYNEAVSTRKVAWAVTTVLLFLANMQIWRRKGFFHISGHLMSLFSGENYKDDSERGRYWIIKESESNGNLKYVLSRDLLNTKVHNGFIFSI